MGKPEEKNLGRRQVLKSGAALAAAAAVAVGAAPAVAAGKKKIIGSNDDILVGVIGTGRMGRSNMNSFLEVEGVRIAALC
ncbi:MAG: hypothetical protein U9P14_07875, partial [Gemmatimonadota bacterium]|nr:hypothetical protein [Gemmatimonadota bacterium]